ncbi:MAG: High-affnity carbon uptake protein Hat/HatR [Myxococcaceae bacterium]|nr:High-affnity carbon uptake protein Hat/HatR [Myxococcaceae bacterium]
MTDRELLFGVLAVQLGFANATQVMACAGEWATDRGGTSLGEILEQRKVLGAEQRALIEGLVEKAVQLNGGSVVRTMQSLPGGSQFVLQSLTRSVVSGKEPAADPSRTEKSFDVPQTDSLDGTWNVCEEIAGRYAHNTGPRGAEEELGRGGIGRVVVAYDQFLGREVALKELLSEHISNPVAGTAQSTALEARFLREARLTGQLEHPAIVPVYEVGRRKDGSLYYTMQRVRGRTLFDAIRAARTFPKRLELLPHFLQVCQAIAYAHSRGVVHRDVKPQNVMIGAFGETFLLDWGLARAKGKADPRAKDLKLAPDITGNVLEGGAIGTPSYMSPEQAEGKIDEIDERSDVWCLGAVLYELLTGRPPYEGVNPFDVLGKILKHPPAPIRSLEPAVPAELAAITGKCLQRDKLQRYATAAELARDIEAWLNGGRVSAHDYKGHELVHRFARRNRLVLWVATAAVVALAAGGFQSYRRVKHERDQAQQFAQLFLDDVSEKLAPLPDSRELLEQLTSKTLDYYRSTVNPKRGPRDERLKLALAWKKIGRLAMKVGKIEEAGRAFTFAREVASALVDEHPQDPDALALEAEAFVGSADVERDQSRDDQAQALFLLALPGAERAAALVPTDVGVLDTYSRVLSRLGAMALSRAQKQEALSYFERGLQVDQRLLALEPGDEQLQDAITVSYQMLGNCQQELGDLAGARATFVQMMEVARQLYEKHPASTTAGLSYAAALQSLGALDRMTGHAADGQARLVRARDLIAQIRQGDPEAVEALANLIATELELGNFEKADQLAGQLRSKGLTGEYTRTFVVASFLSGKLAESLKDGKDSGALTAELFGAMSAALLSDRPGAIARAERASAQVGKTSLLWVFQHVAAVVGTRTVPEAAAVRQLADALDVATLKADDAAIREALRQFVTRINALPSGDGLP